jgi:hypothetical protein
MMIEEFDQYVIDHNIQPHELGAAFGAWMNGATGWDGKMQQVTKEAE